MLPTEPAPAGAVAEPVARVSRRGFVVALALTLVALPLLVLGGFGRGGSGPADSAASDSVTSAVTGRDVLFDEGQASGADLAPGTCAHRTIAFETVVRVTNTTTGISTTCRVGARGPYVAGRIIELDRAVFAEIAPAGAQEITARVEW